MRKTYHHRTPSGVVIELRPVHLIAGAIEANMLSDLNKALKNRPPMPTPPRDWDAYIDADSNDPSLEIERVHYVAGLTEWKSFELIERERIREKIESYTLLKGIVSDPPAEWLAENAELLPENPDRTTVLRVWLADICLDPENPYEQVDDKGNSTNGYAELMDILAGSKAPTEPGVNGAKKRHQPKS